MPVYLGFDASNYLSRSRDVFGGEQGEVGYLPAVPLLVKLARGITGDLSAVRITMYVLVVLLAVAFAVFLRGRLTSPLAVAAGASAFALSPMVAEAVGWYGAGMLLGLALLTAAAPVFDAAFRHPRPQRFVFAALALVVIALTHPFWLVAAAQVVVVAWLVFVALARLRPSPEYALSIRRTAVGLAAAAVVGSIGILLRGEFYSRLDYSTTIRPSTDALHLILDFALRDARWFGVVILAGLAAAIVVGGRVGVWTASVAVVILADLVLLRGTPDYVTRILYVLPLVSGVGVAALVTVARERHLAAGVAVALALSAVSVAIYRDRLDVAVPYYNRVTDGERHAVQFLKNGTGAVLVGSTDPAVQDYYGAVIDGVSARSAPRSLPPPGVPSPQQVERAADVSRLLAGSEILSFGPVEIALEQDATEPAEVAVFVGSVWRPVAHADPEAGRAASVRDSGILIPGTVRPLSSAPLDIVITPTQDGTLIRTTEPASSPVSLTGEMLFARRGITSVLTFAGTPVHRSMEDRPCLTPVYANAGATVWEVRCPRG